MRVKKAGSAEYDKLIMTYLQVAKPIKLGPNYMIFDLGKGEQLKVVRESKMRLATRGILDEAI